MQIKNVEISNRNLSISVNTLKLKQYDFTLNRVYIQQDSLKESSAIAMSTNTSIIKTVPNYVSVST